MSTILIIDDHEPNRYLLRTLLTASGDDVLEAVNGVEGLELARHTRPDMIISDILMPQMDGFALCRECKRDEQLRDIPFIFYTATYTDPRDQALAMQLGAARFIVKPVENEEFIAVLREVQQAHAAGQITAPAPQMEEETIFYRLYNEALIRKLEDKLLDLEQLSRSLAESENHFRMLAENMSDTIWLMDMNLKTTYISPSVTRLRGYTLEEMNALPLEKHMPPDSLQRATRLLDEVLSEVNKSINDSPISRIVELEFYRKDGSKFWSENTFTLIRDPNGTPVAILGAGRDITERKWAEDALRESEERFRSLFENSTIGLYRTTPDGRILMANPTLVHMLGFNDFAELSQRDLEQEGYEPDYPRSQFRQRIEGENMVRGTESSWKRRDGSSIVVRESAKIIRDSDGRALYYEGTVEDITERKRVEEMLRESEDKFKYIFDHSLIGKSITLPSGEVNVNQAFCEMLGYSSDELHDRKWQEITHPEDVELTQKALDPILSGEQESLRLVKRYIHKNGSIVWADIATSLRRDKDGKPLYFMTAIMDITKRKQIEDEIRTLNIELEARVEERTRDLREAQEKLVRQERLAVLGQLAGGVGHELRNPLGVIGNAIYFLRLIQPNADDKTQEYFSIIENETRTAEKIITDLLDYSRIKSVDIEPETVSELFQRVLARYSAPTGVTVSVKIAARLPPVYVDPRQMLQVFGNLVVNAYQAMPEGGKLALSAKKKGDQAVISVQDTGVGIPPENMAKLFEPLFTTKMHGIGLGLAVCKKLVEANNGRIVVHSTPGRGATFSIYLPVYKEES